MLSFPSALLTKSEVCLQKWFAPSGVQGEFENVQFRAIPSGVKMPLSKVLDAGSSPA
jgi:hypothetical protein